MKTHIVSIVLACFGFAAANAQTGKGNFLIGGSMNFQRDKINSQQFTVSSVIQANSSFSISPTVGYFVTSNFLIGLQTSISLGWNTDYKQVKNNIYTAGPIVRYYFPFGKFAVFPEIAAGYNVQKQSNYVTGSPFTYPDTEWKYSSFRGGAGVAWFPVPNIGIEGIFAYKKNTYSKDNDFYHGFASWLYLNVGLQFYLTRNK